MAQSLQTSEVFVKNTFGLPVAVRCTEDAEAISHKNGLSFVELLRPFSQPTSSAQLRDLQGRAYSVRNMRVRFSEPRSEPMPEGKLRLTLGQVVLESGNSDGESRVGQQAITGAGGSVLQYPTPWFDQYCEVFLDNLKQLDYEYIRHYVCVMLVVSTRHPRPVEGFQELYKLQKEAEKAQYPKWLTPNLYYYHVLLHDASEGSPVPVQESYDRVRSAYGPAVCQLLIINSKQPGPTPASKGGVVPDPWRQYVRMPPTMEAKEEVEGYATSKVQFVIGGTKPSVMGPNATLMPREIVLKPSEVREEPMLIDLDSEPTSSPSANMSNVEVGSDPLNQLFGDPQQGGEPPYSLVVQSGSGNLSVSSDSAASGSFVSLDRVGGRSQRVVGQCLSLADHNTLRTFVQEFLFGRLVPHLDSVLRKVHETYSNRHGGVQRFWKAIRKSTSIGGPTLSPSGQGADDSIHDSAELQARLVGDLAFLLHNYEAAYTLYNTARKGLNHVAICYAGALEMSALSAFMMPSNKLNKKDVVTALEEAYSSYVTTVKSTSLALRTIMLLSEVMKEREMYRELTQLILVKMTGPEDDDVRNALFLEQVAHAFLHTKPPMIRKYAFHMVLASHRYYRAMQRVHSRRVLRHAFDVYAQKGWSLAEDFIGFSLARYSFSLHKLDEATMYFERLLSHECSQSPQQQLTNLKEYIFVQKQRLNSASVPQQVPLGMQSTTLASTEQMHHLPSFPVPLIRTSCVAVTFATGVDHAHLSRLVKKCAFQSKGARSALSEDLPAMGEGGHGYSPVLPHRAVSVSDDDLGQFGIGTSSYSPRPSEVSTIEVEREWHTLEAWASGQKEHTFRSSVLYLDDTTDNSYAPMCIVNEPVAVNLVFKNQLQVMLNMVRMSLLWHFTEETQANKIGATTEVIERLILEPDEERPVTFHITPLKEGTIEVVGVVYTLTVQDAHLPGDSPTQPVPRTTLPSLAATAKDSIYERSAGVSVQTVLSEGIQGKVVFGVRGQRLNTSKAERCATMYRPDYRLKWTVIEPQPKIVASLTGLTSWSLIGQVTRLTLEVINCGHAPLESLRLATSLSDHLLLETSPQANLPIYPYQSSSVGSSSSPTPGDPRPHLPPGVTIPLPDGCLHQGQRVTANLLLHSPESVCDIPCNLMFCYKKLGATNASSMRYRVLRHPCTLKVRDSLQVKAYTAHSYVPAKDLTSQGDLNNLLITLEVENRCQVNAAIEIQVLQVSSVSNNWRIQKVDPNQSVPKLLPGVGGLIHLKAMRFADTVPSPKGVWFNDVPLGLDTVNSSQFPTAHFFYSSEAYRSLGVEGKASAPTCDLALIILWKACVPIGADMVYSYGQHTVSIELPQSMTSLSCAPVPLPGPLTPPAYDMVKYLFDHAPTVHHDFSRCALCRVPVKLVVQNCCKAKLEVAVQFVPVKDSTNQSVLFLWSGNISGRRVIELEPNATRTISVYANFTASGVYNLNSVQVEATVTGTTGLFVQRRQRASYVTVME